MFIKTRYIIVIIALVVVAMIIEGKIVAKFVAIKTSFNVETDTVRRYHALCNGGVGWPYSDLIHRLRVLSDSGDTNALSRALREADDRSRDMFEVWLAEDPEAYRESIRKILK